MRIKAQVPSSPAYTNPLVALPDTCFDSFFTLLCDPLCGCFPEAVYSESTRWKSTPNTGWVVSLLALGVLYRKMMGLNIPPFFSLLN